MVLDKREGCDRDFLNENPEVFSERILDYIIIIPVFLFSLVIAFVLYTILFIDRIIKPGD